MVAAVLLLPFAGEGSVAIYCNTYLDDTLGAPTTLIGAVMASGRLVAIPAALAAPPLISRFGHAGTYALATLLGAQALLPMALIPLWPSAAESLVAALARLGVGGPARDGRIGNLRPGLSGYAGGRSWRLTGAGRLVATSFLLASGGSYR